MDPVFIVGFPRSGTTLVAAILDRHSRVSVPPETHFYAWAAARPPVAVSREEGIDQFLKFRYAAPEYLGIQRDQLAAKLPPGISCWCELLRAALECYAAQRGKTILAEKSPENWKHIPQIMADFPNAKIIWVIRDGRDALLSRLETTWGKDEKEDIPLRFQAWRWREMAESMLKRERDYPKRIFRIYYERLVTSPESECCELCTFLGIPFEATQLDHRVATGVVDPHELSWKFRVFEPIDKARVGRWKQGFTDGQKWILDSMMAPVYQALGVRTETTLSRCPRWLRVWHWVVNWTLRTQPRFYRRLVCLVRSLKKTLHPA